MLWLIAALGFLWISGCQGKSLHEDNPVFTQAPARKSLLNRASDSMEGMLAQIRPQSGIEQISFSELDHEPLRSTSIVAEVNGDPIFVSDIVNGFVEKLDSSPELTQERREMYLLQELRNRLPDRIDDEIVLQALREKVPADRLELLEESLEEPFAEMLEKIKADAKVETEDQLREVLARDRLTIADLRATFMRHQMVSGYLHTIADAPKSIDRRELVDYYHSHVADFTSVEKVRVAEIVVRFEDHGGRSGAESVMTNVVTLIQQGREFASIARQYSDKLSRERGGDMGWIGRDELSDSALEEELFSLNAGQTTRVFVRENQFEVYHVSQHDFPRTQTIAEVQADVEQILLQKRIEAARSAAMDKLRQQATVVTIFDAENKSKNQ